MSAKPSRNPLAIVATSDTHGLLEGLEDELTGDKKPDVMVFAGDIAPARFDILPVDYIRKVFFGFVREHSDVEFVYTPGNHDIFAMQWQFIEKEAPKNLHFLMDSGCTIKGYTFYGSPWVPYINGGWAFECEDEVEERDRFARIPDDLDVLVTHTPPRIKHQQLDVSLQFRGGSRPFGSEALWHAILKRKPQMVFCGHIHSGEHKPISYNHAAKAFANEIRQKMKPIDYENSTTMMNVSRVDEHYEIAYDVARVVLMDVSVNLATARH